MILSCLVTRSARLHNNQIIFVEGDACQMPFPDASMDVVLAVECIFHFPSREAFFREAQRVLRPGGQLGLCDFVSVPILKVLQKLFPNASEVLLSGAYGRVDSAVSLADYQSLAQKTGFRLISQTDITRNTLPTYPVVRQIFTQIGDPRAARTTAAVGWISQLGLLRYQVFSFSVQN